MTIRSARRLALVILGSGLLPIASATPTSSAAALSGPYRLTLGFGASCQSSVASVAVALELAERTIAQGTEIEGRPTRSDETNAAEVVLLQRGTSVHGPFATLGSRASREPITTTEGLLVSPWLMLDGTFDAGSGRANGMAIGVLQVGRPEDVIPDSLGWCNATDHKWSLDPS